uniref:Secreted protein n=1 Tax=Ixodes ricinus TaxID=34613 RepID=A0A6B0V8G4_IXORI
MVASLVGLSAFLLRTPFASFGPGIPVLFSRFLFSFSTERFTPASLFSGDSLASLATLSSNLSFFVSGRAPSPGIRTFEPGMGGVGHSEASLSCTEPIFSCSEEANEAGDTSPLALALLKLSSVDGGSSGNGLAVLPSWGLILRLRFGVCNLGFGLALCRFRLRRELNIILQPSTVHLCISRRCTALKWILRAPLSQKVLRQTWHWTRRFPVAGFVVSVLSTMGFQRRFIGLADLRRCFTFRAAKTESIDPGPPPSVRLMAPPSTVSSSSETPSVRLRSELWLRKEEPKLLLLLCVGEDSGVELWLWCWLCRSSMSAVLRPSATDLAISGLDPLRSACRKS